MSNLPGNGSRRVLEAFWAVLMKTIRRHGAPPPATAIFCSEISSDFIPPFSTSPAGPRGNSSGFTALATPP